MSFMVGSSQAGRWLTWWDKDQPRFQMCVFSKSYPTVAALSEMPEGSSSPIEITDVMLKHLLWVLWVLSNYQPFLSCPMAKMEHGAISYEREPTIITFTATSSSPWTSSSWSGHVAVNAGQLSCFSNPSEHTGVIERDQDNEI